MSNIVPIETRSSLKDPVAQKQSLALKQTQAPATADEMEKSRSTMVILDHPEVRRTKVIRSVELVNNMRAIGMDVREVPYTVYSNPKAVGAPLKFDVKDEMKGYENLYQDEAHFEEVFSAVKKLVRRLYTKAKTITQGIEDDKVPDERLSLDQMLALSEINDAEAVGTIRTKALGWFLDPPVAMDMVTTPPSKKWVEVLGIVARAYAKALSNGKKTTFFGEPLPNDVTLKTPDQQLRDWDSDPSDTLTGLPLLASGKDTIPARIAMLACAPDFRGLSGSQWIERYAINLSKACGIPRDLILGATIANRTSSFRKFRTIWKAAPGGYISDMEVRGLGSRVRNVFPIPFPFNYAMAPAYKQMSTARMKMRGLWHSPTDWEAMVSQLTASGNVIVSADFSGMDTRISPSVVQVIAQELLKAGFSRFSCEVLANVQKTMSIFTPSYTGSPDTSTRMSGVIPWLSGYKLTSELDTIYGLATTLSALSEQPSMKDIVQRWERGEFIIYELGDDTIFSLTKRENDSIDWVKFEKDAKRMVGAVVKKDIAPVFLKKIILGKGKSPRMLSRVIQQTFFNENRNEGLPPIVSLIGLKARLEGLKHHPWFEEFYPEFMEIVKTLKFMKELGVSYVEPDTPLTPDQNAALVQYANSLPGTDWLQDLYEQSKYSKAAMDALQLINAALMRVAEGDGRDRKLYADAISRSMTRDEAALLFKARSKFLR